MPVSFPTPAAWSQHARLLTLHTPLGPDGLLASAVRIDEALGPLAAHAGLRIELYALSADAFIDPARLLGQPARLDLATTDGTRPFHGHITACQRAGADGGFGRYRLRIEPWLAFLGERSDAYVFQDMSVFDIVDQLFARWQGQGTLTPAWRWDIADRSAYLIRCTHDRAQPEGGKLWARLGQAPVLGQIRFALPAGRGRKARTVLQRVREISDGAKGRLAVTRRPRAD